MPGPHRRHVLTDGKLQRARLIEPYSRGGSDRARTRETRAPVGTECEGASGAVTDLDRPGALAPEPRTVESLALLRAITSSATVGFGFVDCDCRIVRLNAMLAAITGGTVEGQIGRTLADAVPHL